MLDLESRILEDMGQLDAAFDSAELAAVRDPLMSDCRIGLGVIRIKQRKPHLAISHFINAMELDPALFSPANSLAAAYLEIDEWEKAEELLQGLEEKCPHSLRPRPPGPYEGADCVCEKGLRCK